MQRTEAPVTRIIAERDLVLVDSRVVLAREQHRVVCRIGIDVDPKFQGQRGLGIQRRRVGNLHHWFAFVNEKPWPTFPGAKVAPLRSEPLLLVMASIASPPAGHQLIIPGGTGTVLDDDKIENDAGFSNPLMLCYEHRLHL